MPKVLAEPTSTDEGTVKEYRKGRSTQISEHFKSTEFDCRCPGVVTNCTITYVDTALVRKLEQKRVKWGQPVTIMSGFRCTTHNRNVGGAKGSQHLTGKAADIKVAHMSPRLVAKDCEDFDGLGRYRTWTHVDVRGYHARWGRNH